MEYTRGDWRVGDPFHGCGDEIPIYGEDHHELARVFIHNGEQFANARLIVTAVNACASVNVDNPMAVAKSIKAMFEALKAITSQFSRVDKLYSRDNEIISQAEQALAKAEEKL